MLGWLPAGRSVRLPLHVVAEYARPRWVDVVTAFIPRDPHRVLSRRRLAELLRPHPDDPRELQAVRVGQAVAGRADRDPSDGA